MPLLTRGRNTKGISAAGRRAPQADASVLRVLHEQLALERIDLRG